MDPTDAAAVLDALDEVCIVWDETGDAVGWNRAALDVTGHDEAALAGMAPTDLFAGGDAERVAAAVGEVFETGRARVEAELVGATGDRRAHEFAFRRLPADREGPPAFVALGRDVTDRRRHREALERRARVLREMYDVFADREHALPERIEALLALGRETLDTAYGTLSRIEGDEYVFEVVDAADDAIAAGDVVPLSATNCEIAATTERTLVLGNVARDAPDETDRASYAEWGISCYLGAPVHVDDEVYGTFCFYDTEPRADQFADWEVTLVDLMSRWVSYELERRQTTDRLRRQNERLDRFVSIVSHDLRNPLNVLDGSLDLAAESGDPEAFARCERAVERMETLIDDLLALARAGADAGETDLVDLASFAERCWETVGTRDATLRIETDRVVRADETRLRQLLENLFRNAVEHGSTGSRAEHGSTGSRAESGDSVEHGSTGNRPEAGDSAAHASGDGRADAASADGDRAAGVTVTVGNLPDWFYVEDDGSGVPPEVRDRAFEDGITTTRSGTGIGLSIVADVADAHGWAVDLTTGIDGGARFEFTGVSGAATLEAE